MIRVALVSNAEWKHVKPVDGRSIYYHFFSEALPRHPKLDVDIITHHANRLNVGRIVHEHDVVLLPRVVARSQRLALRGLKDENIPVVHFVDDHHSILKKDVLGSMSSLGVDYTFGFANSGSFYRYYPEDVRYEQIPFGVEPSLYGTVRPWEERHDDVIGISGAMDKPGILRRLYSKWYRRDPKEFSYDHHYKLRTKCNGLPYVMHTQDAYPGQDTDQLPEALSPFKAAIAATTTQITIKYMETPAAGCLTFMEATELNQASTLGYEDGKTAVFINDSNYREKFQEYLNSPDDPRWRRIADAGRAYTMKYLTNDTAAEKLYSLMRTLLGESPM